MNAPRTRIGISDHALCRWLERTGALDIQLMRDMMAAALDRAFQAARRLEARDFVIKVDGLVYVVRDGTVLTVIEETDRAYAVRPAPGEPQT